MECGPYATLSQAECHNFKKIKSLFQSITSATPAELQNMTGQERFPISTPSGLRTLTLAQYAQAIGGGGGGGGVPSHSIAEHNNVVGNPQNGDVLTYNNGNWQPSAPGGSDGWGLQGNNNTTPGTDFIGTTDYKPLVIRSGLNTTTGIIGLSNIALGVGAFSESIHADPYSDYSYNVALGPNALMSATTIGVSGNVAIGASSMQNSGIPVNVEDIISGITYVISEPGDTDFTLIGAFNSQINTVFVATGPGTGTGKAVAFISNNTAAGYNSLLALKAGALNTALGTSTFEHLEYGAYNIGIGTQAGNGLMSGSKNIFIGRYTTTIFQGDNQIVIGDENNSRGANTTAIGKHGTTIATYLSGKLVLDDTAVSGSALLEINSTSQGFLPPRMTGTQAEAIASPAEGLMVYSTDGSGITITSKGWWGFDGTNWTKLN